MNGCSERVGFGRRQYRNIADGRAGLSSSPELTIRVDPVLSGKPETGMESIETGDQRTLTPSIPRLRQTDTHYI